ncbi:hypothetical protein AM501_24320 [Aneurinibacillus migulanus]|jgi:hypothetical protein|uniref:Uncharacterized protein n=1 Tax=Aneurinibacillus migulanus TaxID=47500 RepID=A0A0D1XYL4_ANEMI|nr:hypothetical protein [Aneurinibacillus migulanus]KIV52117.1 hypothetical protein TS65_26845 [Aneurinibacillus migulanus]KIV54193.1 hypothetical protein TS64_13805 [Aneurinibacillus migulanus]KON98258.1 hypothetical protein AF333_25325 [Aneurinibacillus migulanus]KPD05751.1 hypothetical protein AM501_24320 [Aneurinibacillus migulanus]MED0891570.1 hypothetical protein [Aneurinibacillus migulanus]
MKPGQIYNKDMKSHFERKRPPQRDTNKAFRLPSRAIARPDEKGQQLSCCGKPYNKNSETSSRFYRKT